MAESELGMKTGADFSCSVLGADPDYQELLTRVNNTELSKDEVDAAFTLLTRRYWQLYVSLCPQDLIQEAYLLGAREV